MRSLAVVFVVGCGSAPTVSPPPPMPARVPAPPRAASVPPLTIPPPAPVAKSQQLCSRVAQPPVVVTGRLRTYEFSPMPLAPEPSGAIPAGYRRHPDSIRAAVAAEADSIAACTQEAARRGVRTPPRVGSRGHFELATTLTIDPFGVPSQVTVDGDGDAAMRECIRGVLSLARVARRTPRETVAKVPLYLLGSPDGPKKLPKPPPVRAAPRTERAGCVRALDPLPRDTIDVPEVVIEWLPGEYSNPRQWCGLRDLDKAQIRRVREDSRYAFEACFAAAPTTRGQLDLQFVIGAHGVATNIAASGAGDAALHACMVAALADVGFSRVDTPILVSWSFALGPAPTQTFAADCAGRAAWIATLSVHDPRAWAAIDDLARERCDFPEALDRFARFTVPDARAAMYRGRGTVEGLEATAKIVTAFPAAAPRLLPFLADAQLVLGREADARATYLRYLALPGRDAAQIERAAEGYAQAVALRDGTAPLDFCEESTPY